MPEADEHEDLEKRGVELRIRLVTLGTNPNPDQEAVNSLIAETRAHWDLVEKSYIRRSSRRAAAICPVMFAPGVATGILMKSFREQEYTKEEMAKDSMVVGSIALGSTLASILGFLLAKRRIRRTFANIRSSFSPVFDKLQKKD